MEPDTWFYQTTVCEGNVCHFVTSTTPPPSPTFLELLPRFACIVLLFSAVLYVLLVALYGCYLVCKIILTKTYAILRWVWLKIVIPLARRRSKVIHIVFGQRLQTKKTHVVAHIKRTQRHKNVSKNVNRQTRRWNNRLDRNSCFHRRGLCSHSRFSMGKD